MAAPSELTVIGRKIAVPLFPLYLTLHDALL